MWTPGGTHLAYGFASGICTWIYVVRLDGTDVCPLIDFGKEVAFAPAASSSRLGASFATGAVGSRRWPPRQPLDVVPSTKVVIQDAALARVGEDRG